MPSSLEERVAYLEGKVEEHSRGFEEVRASIGRVDAHVLALDGKVDRFRDELSARIDALGREHGGRMDGLGSRIDAIGSRVDALDQKVDRFRDELNRTMSRQFTWIVGVQVTVLVVVIGSLIR